MARKFDVKKFAVVLNTFKNQNPEFKKDELIAVLKYNNLVSNNTFWGFFKKSSIIKKTDVGWKFNKQGVNNPIFIGEIMQMYNLYKDYMKKHGPKEKVHPEIAAMRAKVEQLYYELHIEYAKKCKEYGWRVINEQGFPVV